MVGETLHFQETKTTSAAHPRLSIMPLMLCLAKIWRMTLAVLRVRNMQWPYPSLKVYKVSKGVASYWDGATATGKFQAIGMPWNASHGYIVRLRFDFDYNWIYTESIQISTLQGNQVAQWAQWKVQAIAGLHHPMRWRRKQVLQSSRTPGPSEYSFQLMSTDDHWLVSDDSDIRSQHVPPHPAMVWTK